MPAQLLARLNRYLDVQQAQIINALEPLARNDVTVPAPPDPDKPGEPPRNTRPHWPAGTFGDVMASVECVVIHETSGWPSYQSAPNFRQLYRSLDSHAFGGSPPHWTDRRGIGPQYFVDPNGTAFVLIGPEDLDGDPRQTWHAIGMSSFALGIENADSGDSDDVQPGNGLGPRWWRLSNQAQDLTGMKVFLVLHPRGAEDVNLIWIAQFPSFAGSGDIIDGTNPATDRRINRPANWNNMLFTERDYRTLALLCRLLAEQNGLPRNFPLLPYLDDSSDNADRALFRRLILSDQRRDAIATKLGTTTAVIVANAAAYRTFYDAHSLRIWRRFFGVNPGVAGADQPCFRGFLSHDINGGHPCPGPLFDWHRFAREVWDWWWYPFDVTPVAVTTQPRPYLQARKNTQLIDYYWDATGAAQDYDAVHPPLSLTEPFRQRYLLPAFTPIYALANGVVVAARFALSDNPAASGFLLVRHEVFHQLAAGNHINYDQLPTFVWSLIYFLDNAGFSVAQIGAANPDWLNRFVLRLTECELAVTFHNANSGPAVPNAALRAALNRGWAHDLSGGAGPRVATGQEIERDATAYRAIANEMRVGRHALFPLEANPIPTPVRVILGDYLGNPNRMTQNQQGIQVEIFSNNRLDVPGVVQRASLSSNEAWWAAASAAIRHEAAVEMDLPPNGVAWHYGLTEFLEWLNARTWTSEWQKYGVVGADGAPAPAPARPISRRVT
ncbi:MAG TPA: hypothetical protein VF933_36725 [Streptosporangiaceae bacterium]